APSSRRLRCVCVSSQLSSSFFTRHGAHRDLHSFPTRRSSDLADVLAAQPVTTNLLKFMRASIKMIGVSNLQSFIEARINLRDLSDRKSGSAGMPRAMSYAVFCLKKKTYRHTTTAEAHMWRRMH